MRITTLAELTVDGRPVRGERLAAVVRALVEHAGRPVPTGTLVDEVWDGDPPEDAAGAVQALVSRVRRLGLDVEATPGGYRLRSDGLEVDSARARRLVADARAALPRDPRAGARLAADALDLFAAPPPPDRSTADTLYVQALTVDAEAALATGDAARVTEPLRAAAHRTPPDEPLVALLVRVLAAQGRDAEALALVEELRAELAETYGADPSPVVAQAHVALLRGELAGPPAAAPAPPVPPPVARDAAHLPPSWRRSATALVGRDDDVRHVEEALRVAPLVTVVATGGAGKTRIAAEVARRAAADAPVRVVELAGLRSGSEVLPAVLAAIGGGDATATHADLQLERRLLSESERIGVAAQDLDGLLVLDNCEHVLTATADVVAELVAVTPPGFVVLATSRAPLGVVGEVVHHLEALPDDDALALLEARARAGRATLGWDRERALELVRRLDRLPLAIELAAARLRSMSVDDVLDGLRDRFGLLDDALRGLPERHASLWAMVDWSWTLLDERGRELLDRLAVVPAPFTAETAAAVAGRGLLDVRRDLAALVDQSLLVLDEGDGPPRYRMLETVREYAGTRLDASGHRPQAMAGLVAWATELADEQRPRFVGRTQVATLELCAREQDSLVAAMRWALEHDDEASAHRVAATLFMLWTVRGLHTEVIGWTRRLLFADDGAARARSALLHGEGDRRPAADPLVMTTLLGGLNSGISGELRTGALAKRVLERTLPARAAELTPRTAAMASLFEVFGDFDLAATATTAERLEASDDTYLVALGLFLRAAAEENAGEREVAGRHARDAYAAFERIGDEWGMGMAAQGIGQWGTQWDDPEAARWLAAGARHLELVGAAQDARSVRVLLDVHRAVEGDDDALRRLEALAASAQSEPIDVGQALLGLADVALRRGDLAGARARGEQVLAQLGSDAVPMPQPRVVFAVAAASLLLLSGGPDGVDLARATLARAGEDAVAAVDAPMLGSLALGWAHLEAHAGDPERARELWRLGMRLGARLESVFDLSLDEVATRVLGDADERRRLADELRGMPAREASARVRALLGL